MSDLRDIALQVRGFAWSEPDWLPALNTVSWPLLEHHRDSHQRALEAYLATRENGKRGEASALRKLCDAVEAATRALDANFDADLGWRRSYSEQRNELQEAALPPGIPLHADGLRKWESEASERGEAHLVDLAWRRLRLREDAEALGSLRTSVLRGPERLRDGLIQAEVIAQAQAVKDALGEAA